MFRRKSPFWYVLTGLNHTKRNWYNKEDQQHKHNETEKKFPIERVMKSISALFVFRVKHHTHCAHIIRVGDVDEFGKHTHTQNAIGLAFMFITYYLLGVK